METNPTMKNIIERYPRAAVRDDNAVRNNVEADGNEELQVAIRDSSTGVLKEPVVEEFVN